MTMRVGLIQCGHVHPELVPTTGDYPELFGDLLAGHDIDLVTFDVTRAAPPATDACEGWLITGSADSAYDPLPWIEPVEKFLRALVEEGRPVVAICFGHQLLAQALGATVVRADGGWGVGAHRYEVVGPPRPWMDPPARAVTLIASHQDQVVSLPPGAELVARTDHCPVAAFTVGPAALAIQPHPEFTAAVSEGLIVRRRDRIGAERADLALARLGEGLDQALVGGWMASFLHQARG